jgi:hypothetical protein
MRDIAHGVRPKTLQTVEISDSQRGLLDVAGSFSTRRFALTAVAESADSPRGSGDGVAAARRFC